MTALLDQLPALVGVLLGAAGAMASSTLTDRLRWRRDHAVRWDQRRIDSYVAFGSTLKDAVRISHRLTSSHRLQPDFGMDRATAMNELDAASAQNSKDWERLLLLGDSDVVDAGRRWRLAAQALVAVALRDKWDAADWTAAVHHLDQTRDEFHAAARRSLGVSGRSVAQFNYLREMHGDAATPAHRSEHQAEDYCPAAPAPPGALLSSSRAPQPPGRQSRPEQPTCAGPM